MKAMVLERYHEPLVLRELEIPAIGPDDILVKVMACSVCNTDNKVKLGLIRSVKLPVIPGHEPAGVIVEIGSQVKGLQIGDRVTFLHYISCGKCRNCLSGRSNACLKSFRRLGFELNGGFAQYMVAPAANALVVPPSLSFEEAALIPDAICTSVHAFMDRAPIKAGDRVLILGLGGLGIHGLQVAKSLGAVTIAADVDNRKLALAKELGADWIVNPHEENLALVCRDLTEGCGFDIVGEFVGIQDTWELGLKTLKVGGTMVLVGYSPGTTFPVSSEDIVMGEKSIVGSKSRLMHNLQFGLQLVLNKQVIPQIDATFPLEEANQVLDRLDNEGFLGRGVLVMHR